MAEESTDLEWYRGDSYTREVTVTNKVTGLPIPLTGQTITMYVDTEEEPVGGTELFQLSGTITDAPGGKFTITPSTVQNTMDREVYYYQIKMTEGTDVRTIGVGKYEII